MSKKPVPKKQQSNKQTSARYKTFQNRARKRLLALVSLNDCPNCSKKKLSHTACPACGHYKGRVVVDKSRKIEKIIRVKA